MEDLSLVPGEGLTDHRALGQEIPPRFPVSHTLIQAVGGGNALQGGLVESGRDGLPLYLQETVELAVGVIQRNARRLHTPHAKGDNADTALGGFCEHGVELCSFVTSIRKEEQQLLVLRIFREDLETRGNGVGDV